MTQRAEGLALTEIAKLAEVRVSAASNWRKRHADFPQPTVVTGQELFAADQVARWLSQRKIARNGLRPDEAPGTTYGDRFIRNGGLPAPSTQAEPSRDHAEDRSDWSNGLWQIMDLLRSDLEPGSAVDFIMAMLYLRTTNAPLWHMVTEQFSWHAIDHMVHDVLLREHGVPLFPAIAPGHSSRRLVEAIRLFDQIDLDTVGSALVFDTLLERVNRDLGRQGGHFTPSSVVRCVVNILEPVRTDNVYDLSCGSGELLAAAAEHGVRSVSGQVMNGRSLRMTLLNLSMHDSNPELRIGGPEILRDSFPGNQFDVILSNPPFNPALPDDAEHDAWPFEAPTKSTANFAWLQLAAYKLKPGGRAAILMPNGTLFTGGLSAEIRRKMIDAGVIEGIIAFPARLFAATGIPVSLWLLRLPKPPEHPPSEILFIDATSMGTMNERAQRILSEDEIAKIAQQYRDWRDSGRSGNPHNVAVFARSVGIEEIKQNGYDLQPRRYMPEDTDSRSDLADTPAARLESLKRQLDELADLARRTSRNIDTRLKALRDSAAGKWHEVSLGDICDIQTGPGAVDRQRGLTVPGWTPLVLPRNIKRGHLSHDELDTVRPEISAKLGNYRLRQGDIVSPRSGTLGRHGVVRESEDGWLLGPSCMRLRPRGDNVVPEYLVHYMNSPEVHTWIMSRSQRATAIPHINAPTLRELAIPLPSPAVQREIAATMDSINLHIEQLQRGALTTQSLRDLVFPSLTEA